MFISGQNRARRRWLILNALVLLICLLLIPEKVLCKSSGRKIPTETRREIMRLLRSSDPLSMEEGEAQWLAEELEIYVPSLGEHWQSLLDFWQYANTEMPIHIDTVPDDLPDSDRLCFIVLGYQLNANGTMRDELIGRLETALKCAERYPEAMILCTGGPTAREYPEKSEAKEMTKWLKRHGVSKDRILTEGQSLTTTKNASYSYRLLRSKAPQVDSVVIVSSEYHIVWGSVLFEAQFLLAADAEDGQKVRVISNVAYDTEEHTGDSFPFHGSVSDLIRMNNIEKRYFQ